jgi:hypothetical protein
MRITIYPEVDEAIKEALGKAIENLGWQLVKPDQRSDLAIVSADPMYLAVVDQAKENSDCVIAVGDFYYYANIYAFLQQGASHFYTAPVSPEEAEKILLSQLQPEMAP